MKKMVAMLLLVVMMLIAAGCAQQEPLPNLSHDGGFVLEEEQPQLQAENEQQELYTDSGGCKARLTNEQLLEHPQIILRGVPVVKVNEWMLNPDGTRTDGQGNPIVNERITEYAIEVNEVYRGVWDEEYIHIKISDGYGWTPAEIINGEENGAGSCTTGDAAQWLPLEKEAIFFLSWSDSGLEEEHGYYISVCPLGYLTLNEDGTCINEDGNSYSLKDLK